MKKYLLDTSVVAGYLLARSRAIQLYYYLEYRRAIGFDTILKDISKSASVDFYEGILIHTWDGKTPAVTNLVTKYISTDFMIPYRLLCSEGM
jgi:hypothetical protein